MTNTTTGQVRESGTRFKGTNEGGFSRFFDTRDECERWVRGETVSDTVTRENRDSNTGSTRSRGSRR